MLDKLTSPQIIHFLQLYGYVTVSLGVGIESMGVPFPGESVLIAAAIYAGAGHLSILGVIIAGAFGAIVGDNIGYSIGRFGGSRVLKKYGRYIKINTKHMEYAGNYFTKHGGKTVFFGRFISILRTWAAFFAGTNNMHWQKFFFYNAAGGILWSVCFSLLGYFLGKNLTLLEKILKDLSIFGAVAAVVIISAVIISWRRILKNIG